MGSFEGKLNFDLIEVKGETLVVVKAPFAYKINENEKIVIPIDFISDGASIPSYCWSIPGIGHPLKYKNLQAALVHDYMCKLEEYNRDQKLPHLYTWQQTHKIFHQALLDAGKPRISAYLMYSAVYGAWIVQKSRRW